MSDVYPMILQQALQLPLIERARLVEEIFRSFETEHERLVLKAWATEAEKRLDAFEKGELSVLSYEEVKSSLQG